MLSRRRVLLLSGIGAGVAAGYSFYKKDHELPPRDVAAEKRFRERQDRLFKSTGLVATSHFVDIPKPALQVHVIQGGQGQPLLFVHGGNSVAASWTPLLARLQERFRLYAPDRPGCGLTTKFNYAGVQLRQHAVDFLASTMDALGLAQAPIVANSMGGYFSLVFALERPARVSRLVLVGEPAGSAESIRFSHRLIGTRGVNSLLYATALRLGPGAARKAHERMLVANIRRVSDEYLECMDEAAAIPGALESWLTMVETGAAIPAAGVFYPRSVLTHSLRPELSNLRCPTLFLWGEKDTFGPPSLGNEMARLIPGARCVIVPDAGHALWLDQPEICAREIASFVV